MSHTFIQRKRILPASISNTDNSEDGTDTNSYSFTSQSFGAAQVGDYIIVAITGRAINSRTISSVTIDGETATVVVFDDFTYSSYDNVAAIAIAPASGNGSGTVAITFSGSMVRCGIGVYLATDLQSSTPTDTGIGEGATPSDTLNIDANGIAVGVTFSTDSGSAWTNLTSDYNVEIESGYYHHAASDEFATEQTALSISNDASGSSSVMVLASFR